jgi:hygromycin-B 7''-O-kinase
MNRLLPKIDAAGTYEIALADGRPYVRAVEEICRQHGLPPPGPRYSSGAIPTFPIGEHHVLKLFPPPARANFDRERKLLPYLEGKLEVPTPALHTAGEFEDWPYLIIQQLPGKDLRKMWPQLAREDQLRLAGDIGCLLAQLHALSTEGLEEFREDWSTFLESQSRACLAHHLQQGAEASWVNQIPGYLASVPLMPPHRLVLLHTEVMREHVLTAQRAGHWELSGFIDFEAARIGHFEYEFAAVGVFLSEGDPEVLARLLLGYGLEPGEPSLAMQERFMAYALLHRYSNLKWLLERMPPSPGTSTLRELARQWWALPVAGGRAAPAPRSP